MLHTTDLMLGNWVEYAVGNGKRSIPMQVTGIFSDTVYLNFEGNEGDVFDDKDENLLGIEITADILERCGMTKVALSAYKDNSVAVYVDLINTEYRISREGNAIKVRYLHQLQNAYFMLTGKQLEVKL